MAEIVYVPTKSATKYTEMEKNLLLGIIILCLLLGEGTGK